MHLCKQVETDVLIDSQKDKPEHVGIKKLNIEISTESWSEAVMASEWLASILEDGQLLVEYLLSRKQKRKALNMGAQGG